MTRTPKNRKVGLKQGVFAMRFDPKIKYMAELAARRERRSLTNFVEWAIDEALRKVVFVNSGSRKATAADLAEDLWAPDPADRLRRLNQHCPDLLVHEERQLIAEIASFSVSEQEAPAFMRGEEINWQLVKACWEQLQAYVSGNGSAGALADAVRSSTASAEKK